MSNQVSNSLKPGCARLYVSIIQLLCLNFQITIVKIYAKSFQKLYFKATKYEMHNEATMLKSVKCKYIEFWFDIKLACRL